MKKRQSASSHENFAITDNVLLLFNELDTKIALNWECDFRRSQVNENSNVCS